MLAGKAQQAKITPLSRVEIGSPRIRPLTARIKIKKSNIILKSKVTIFFFVVFYRYTQSDWTVVHLGLVTAITVMHVTPLTGPSPRFHIIYS